MTDEQIIISYMVAMLIAYGIVSVLSIRQRKKEREELKKHPKFSSHPHPTNNSRFEGGRPSLLLANELIIKK